jgi:hypothetical protein
MDKKTDLMNFVTHGPVTTERGTHVRAYETDELRTEPVTEQFGLLHQKQKNGVQRLLFSHYTSCATRHLRK